MLEKDPAKRPGLDEVVRVLRGPWEEERELPEAQYLLVAVEAKKGAVRLLDLEGTPARLLSGVGSGAGQFPSPPLAVAADPEGGSGSPSSSTGRGSSTASPPKGRSSSPPGPTG